MRNVSHDAYFDFDFFSSLLVGKWAWPPRVPLIVWGLQTRPKSWPTGWTIWTDHYYSIISQNHVFEISRPEPPPSLNFFGGQILSKMWLISGKLFN